MIRYARFPNLKNINIKSIVLRLFYRYKLSKILVLKNEKYATIFAFLKTLY